MTSASNSYKEKDEPGGLNRTTISYDAESRISKVDNGTDSYAYNPLGNRVRKDVNGSVSTEYFYYFNNQIIPENKVSTGAITSYVFFNGNRTARRVTGSVEYYFSDDLKTAAVITDSAGNIKSESDYYPWGGRVALDKRKSSVKQQVTLSMPGHRDAGQVATKKTHEEVTRFLNHVAVELTSHQPSIRSRIRETMILLEKVDDVF